jgi:AcrR family transcriptional regulator
MVDICSEHGLAEATIARVVAHAGVSRRTFYEIFEDREECFLAALDDAIARVSRRVLDAYDANAGWGEQVRAALIALLSFLEVEREAGRLLLICSLGAGPRALERRQRTLAQAIIFIDGGRKQARTTGSQPPPLTAEGLVGGVLSILHARLVDSSASVMPGVQSENPEGSLLCLTSSLVGMIVLPYLGASAARRELARPAPKPRVPVEHGNGDGGGDPLRGLGMRLTYRTVRVLMAVGSRPGSSNRELGGAAGVADQGQISKLLSRLQRLGLVQNTGVTCDRGGPNAWVLTERGARVEQVMNAENRHPETEASGGRSLR